MTDAGSKGGPDSDQSSRESGARPSWGGVLALLPLGLPILGVGVAYTSELVYLQHFGVPAWMLPRPEAVDVAAVMLPLFLVATILLGLLALVGAVLSAGWTRALVAVVAVVAGVRHGLAGPGARGLGWWGAAAGGAYLVWVGGVAWWRTRRPAPTARGPRFGARLRAWGDRVRTWWAEGADSDASWRRWLVGLPAVLAGAPRAAGVGARRAQLERVERAVLLAFLAALTALEGAVVRGRWQAEGQIAFDLAGVNGEWVVLRHVGEQRLAVGRDTVCKRVLRLTGAVGLLKAGPDSEPVVIRRDTLAQPGQALPGRPGRPDRRPPDPPECGADAGWAAGPGADTRARTDAHAPAPPSAAARTSPSAGPPDPVPPSACPAGLADTAVRLVVVERRRVPAWRVTYVVRRGPLRGDSLRIVIPAAPTAAAAACRADSVLVGALGAAFGGPPAGTPRDGRRAAR